MLCKMRSDISDIYMVSSYRKLYIHAVRCHSLAIEIELKFDKNNKLKSVKSIQHFHKTFGPTMLPGFSLKSIRLNTKPTQYITELELGYKLGLIMLCKLQFQWVFGAVILIRVKRTIEHEIFWQISQGSFLLLHLLKCIY